ncbi:hypothetical protein RMSM_06620 [Rhodopirellula maiorica SM1]|uniref:Replication-relaxation n=1 Tax=Rhodopirellula maiorica SM1 TaxID=1265738 RepID=M5RM50_9BACT|nr:replication-relaxation family protein [Rhodopirellula maiorica]EMI16462.1 hypothetical protein RMSM_06620 [Rhodopirellula maiorica SM1]
MAKENGTALTARDLEILTSLDRIPMTPRQLQVVSESFRQPFSDEALVRRRLGRLKDAGFLQAFPYSLVSEGRAPKYWKLTRAGYRIIYGSDASLPGRRYFSEVSAGHHVHAHSLASMVAHLEASAARHNIEMDQYARENSIKFHSGQSHVSPDGAFRLLHRYESARPYSFVIEMDNGSERVRSNKDIESIQRKVQTYDHHQSRYKRDDPARYLVLFVTTRSERRLEHVLSTCSSLIRNPDRTLFLGATLEALLAVDPFSEPVLQSNNGLRRTLVPR